jgi:hypothetical protein
VRARWFVRVQSLEGTLPALTCQPQVSPDGLEWCDEESAPLVLHAPGLATRKLRDFGPWLRLKCHAQDGQDPAQPTSVKVTIYLALKE